VRFETVNQSILPRAGQEQDAESQHEARGYIYLYITPHVTFPRSLTPDGPGLRVRLSLPVWGLGMGIHHQYSEATSSHFVDSDHGTRINTNGGPLLMVGS